MVRPGLRRMKSVKKRIPSGKVKTVYRRGVYSKHKCAICSAELAGTPRGKPIKIQRLTRSKRRPTRPFGGQLCSKCTRKIVALRAKLKLKLISIDTIPLSLRKYVIGE